MKHTSNHKPLTMPPISSLGAGYHPGGQSAQWVESGTDVRVFLWQSGICTFSCRGNTVGMALVWSPVGSIKLYQELMNKGGQKHKI